MHARATEGHWHNLLCNALDGSEDCLACGDAAGLWADMGTPAEREADIRDVWVFCAAGGL